ncbi:MAG: 3-keto-disaccharide hydrolase [Pirellulales bacterium]
MKSRTLLLGGLLSALLARPVLPADEESPPDPVMGNWEGTWQSDEEVSGKLTAQIIALGEGKYGGTFFAEVDQETLVLPVTLTRTGQETISLEGTAGRVEEQGVEYKVSGTVENAELEGRYSNNETAGRIQLQRVFKKSPTLGAAPPEGALVLFDGSTLDNWQGPGGGPARWKLVDGAMEVVPGSGDIITKDKFTDFRLHLEFRTPFMPKARGQGRGNSGVYLQGRYEVQVLDSFGLEGRDNECGGIYRQHRPSQNACLPPGQWQTYDITFRAPRTDDDGQVTEPARLTVVHNGITIHDDAELSGPTFGGLGGRVSEPGPILLQDHGNLVRYRNIWLVPQLENE